LCSIKKFSVSPGFAKQNMPILCYNGSLVTWTVVRLTAAKFKPLIFSALDYDFRENNIQESSSYLTGNISSVTTTNQSVLIRRMYIMWAKRRVSGCWMKWWIPLGLSPYRGEEFCAPQWPGELCWRECKLLVEPIMAYRWRGTGQVKSFRLGAGCGAYIPPWKMYCHETFTARTGGQDAHRVAAPVKENLWRW
jgi:hypothetical protein